MKFNTPKFLCVPCDQIGSLSLVGVVDQTATFIATGIIVFGDLEKHLNATPKIKNYTITHPVKGTERIDGAEIVIIFECGFTGTLRNPKGFLKSIRHLLNGILYRTNAECEELLKTDPSDATGCDDLEDDEEDGYEYEDEDDDEESYDEYCERKDLCPRCGSLLGECFCGYHDELMRYAEGHGPCPY